MHLVGLYYKNLKKLNNTVSHVGLLTVTKHAVIICYKIVRPASFCDMISGFPKQIRKLSLHKNKYDINK